MSRSGYTLILTKGTHLVSETAAAAILHAVQAREPLVDIELDPFGGSEPRTTSLATAHVVALMRNPDVRAAEPVTAPDNLRRLRAPR